MIKRNYFMAAKCTGINGYAFTSGIVSHHSAFAQPSFVFDGICKKLEDELLKIRPNGQFEVVAFNRV